MKLKSNMKLKINNPKIFKIKETDSIEKIKDMQKDLEATIKKLEDLNHAVKKLIEEKEKC